MGNKAIKFKDNTGNSVYPCPYYPVGSIYISVNNINPSEFFGGKWEQIKDDVYLKIVTSDAGKINGTSKNHKIPLSSIPPHQHTMLFDQSANGGTEWLKTGGNSGGPFYSNIYCGSAGGGQSYYPYYLGIYVWKRTA